jgi:uncharacterized membrane protein YidH (DUF202 family)
VSRTTERTWLAWWRTALTATAGVAFTVVLVGAQI